MSIFAQNEIFRKHYPNKQLTAYLKIWVADLVMSINVKQSLNESQIDFVASSLYELGSWKITDLTLFFKRIKQGYFGELYENLSAQKIIEWGRVYFNERHEAAEMISEGDEKPFTGNTKVHPEVIKVMFEGVGKDEEPKALEIKKDTFLDSDKGFRAYVSNTLKVASVPEIVESFYRWFIRTDLSMYCDLFVAELELRELSGEYKKAKVSCKRLLKISGMLSAMRTPDVDKEEEDILKSIAIFIEQN